MNTERVSIEETETRTQKIRRLDVPKSHRAGRPGHIFLPIMIGADTHPGLIRSENQDSFAYSLSDDGRMAFLLVADGIGGNESGDLASRFVAQMMLREFQVFQKNGSVTTDQALNFLRSRITLTNSALRNLNTNYNVIRPMGTTIAALIMLPNHVVTAHAGDSRIYCLRGGQ